MIVDIYIYIIFIVILGNFISYKLDFFFFFFYSLVLNCIGCAVILSRFSSFMIFDIYNFYGNFKSKYFYKLAVSYSLVLTCF